MLKRLVISNYALISHLDMSLPDGMISITGETGAGKSILLGAIGLILGQRADTSVVSENTDKCIIEGHFSLANLHLVDLFNHHDLDFDEECIFRREISQNGKSRAFINDTPVNLAVLKEIGSRLVEIQTQHTNLLMAQTEVQRELVDAALENAEDLSNYRSCFNLFRTTEKDLVKAKNTLSDAIKEQGYKEFLFQEIESLQLVAGEEQELESSIKVLTQASEIKERFSQVALGLSGGEFNVRNLLNQVIQLIKSYETISPQFADFLQRIKSVSYEIEDLAIEAQNTVDETDEDGEKLLQLNERFDKIQHLFRKHQVSDTSSLIRIAAELESTLVDNANLEVKIADLEATLTRSKKQLEQVAKQLHEARIKSATELSERATTLLHRLNMPYAQVAFDITMNLDNFNEYGADTIKLLFTSNPGIKLQNVADIASGGELSRLNFAFRSILSEKKRLPTLIYDEADTGISGEVAAKMGELFRELGKHHQILCITHLPQVAAAGNHQWEVRKIQHPNYTETTVNLLNPEERSFSIAKMLSGAEVNELALAQAKHLLDQH